MSDPPPPTEEIPVRRSSPAPGCCILAAIVLVFGGLIVLYVTVGFYQYNHLETFTETTPAPLDIAAPSAEQVASAQAKLQQVAAAVAAGRAERFLFSADELNTLIASVEAAAGFRGNTRIESIGSDGIVAAMAQPLRKGPFQKGFRYLNGDFTLQPELRARTIAFKLTAIDPSVGEVPPPFVKSYASLDLFRLDPDLPAMEAHASSLSAVYTEGDHLVVETKVATAPNAALPDEATDPDRDPPKGDPSR